MQLVELVGIVTSRGVLGSWQLSSTSSTERMTSSTEEKPMSDETFQDKLDRSSFGTPEAKAAMASVPQEKVDKVLARVEELRRKERRFTGDDPRG